ncbi:cytochrome P450 [Fomitopsis serialis]|uniref:cytochrome P450 n=1 Tax=Fomitopsis serialis TaxID=139415 RepID=UPI002008A5CF|nr:cytochrome P450 [Neoantrodia serialis]KAH9918497.1 cytochrome P450 [Neoantrodia serialis]
MYEQEIVYALILAALLLLLARRRMNPLYRIPAVGPSAPILSYGGALKFSVNAREMLQEGYTKYRGSVFRVPLMDRWLVVVSGAAMNEELRKLPDDQMSFLDAAEDLLQAKYTIAKDILRNPIHIPVIRGPFTRNLAAFMPDVADEIASAVQEAVPDAGDEWVGVVASPAMARVVCRASNRVFIGLPMCRNPEFLEIVLNYTKDVGKSRFIMALTPILFKPIVGSLLPWSKNTLKKIAVLVGPLVNETFRQFEDHGKKWEDRPKNLLTWLTEEAKAAGHGPEVVISALLSSNFTAIHTSAISVTHALYHIAACPEFVPPLRKEIEVAVNKYGWGKQAIGEMWKLDSFMRESQRVNGTSGVSVMRKALVDLRLAGGTVIPAGTLLCAAADATHCDDENYEDAGVFKPFRFSDMSAEESERIKHQFVSTSPEYVPFGHGKHACPGRFFVGNELKMIIAYLVLNYDMKFEDDGPRPPNKWLSVTVIPDPSAKVYFRKRQTGSV